MLTDILNLTGHRAVPAAFGTSDISAVIGRLSTKGKCSEEITGFDWSRGSTVGTTTEPLPVAWNVWH